MVWASRLLVLAVGVVGYFVALIQPPTVFGIVAFVTSVLGSAFLPAYVCAVWWRRANTPGAFVSMVAGAGVAVLWQLAGLDAASGLHAMLAGLLTSTASMIVVSLATQRIAPTPARVIELMNEAAS